MENQLNDPSRLHSRVKVEVERRAWRLHRENIAAWARSESGTIPTFEEAVAVEFSTTEILLSGLGQLSFQAPDEVFLESLRWMDWLNDE